MRFGGIIEKLDKIIVSDPSYDDNVDCRYEQNNINGKNWRITIEIKEVSEKYKDIQIRGIQFFVLLHDSERPCLLVENGTFTHQPDDKIKEFMIGMDTACISFGINELADEIMEEKDEWQPYNSLKTLTDGAFGTLKEGKTDDKVDFIVFSGYLDEDTGYTIQDVVDYIVEQFQVKELYQEIENKKYPIENNDLDNINYEI